MRLLHITSEPEAKGQIEEQTQECINLIQKQLDKSSQPIENVVSLTFFLNAFNGKDYYPKRETVYQILKKNNLHSLPANFLAQPPAGGQELTAEIHLLPVSENVTVEQKSIDGINYVVANCISGAKAVFASGLSADFTSRHNIRRCSEASFSKMQLILAEEEMSFGDIVRQWNYIENITHVDVIEGKDKQHYQIFNDVRSIYYNQVEFTEGYPAATGIGTHSGGVIISFYAVKDQNGSEIKAIENPLQIAAYDYSESVLIGDATLESLNKTSPKFSRAKFTGCSFGKAIFISGTASIREEKTVALGQPEEQTLYTIENIEHLISTDNLKASGVLVSHRPVIQYYRVYIKNKKDAEVVINKCKEIYGDTPANFVVSDICRDDLLLEIEGIAS